MLHLLLITPNTAGTVFMWFLLVGFAAAVAIAVHGYNKANRSTIKK